MDIAKEIERENDTLLFAGTWKGGGADAESFYSKGIKTLYFVTTNSYRHLHLLTDTPETLNPGLFESVTGLAYLTAVNIANDL